MTPLTCEYKETLLKVEGVSLPLGGVPILRDVNLEIKDLYREGYTQGQVVGLLGPSGGGKTTLFRILTGLDAPDTVAVLIEKEGKAVERGMGGGVGQSYPLLSHHTIRGNR